MHVAFLLTPTLPHPHSSPSLIIPHILPSLFTSPDQGSSDEGASHDVDADAGVVEVKLTLSLNLTLMFHPKLTLT
jgi:hypothetical protein